MKTWSAYVPQDAFDAASELVGDRFVEALPRKRYTLVRVREADAGALADELTPHIADRPELRNFVRQLEHIETKARDRG